ncbi:MAG: DUF4091 domain-containing protein [Bacteroidia bacterium]|nr:DUF4091 domain-containing protein [Bacteroidia bacterium]
MKRELVVKRILISLMILAIVSLKAGSQISKTQLQIPLIKSAPVIDGNLSDDSWLKASEMSEFVNWTLDSYIKDPVSVFLYFDEKNLYVAFRNYDPVAEELRKTVSPKGPRDTFLWGRNHAMVGIGYNDTYIQLMADPKGTMTDWKDSDIRWNGNWQFSASINKADWTCEFSIPLSDFGLTNIDSGSELNLTLSRSYPHGESSNWGGRCNLSSKTTVKCDIGKWSPPVPGKNQITFNAQNSGKENLTISCELKLIPLNGTPEFINQQGQGPSSELQIRTSSEPLIYRTDFKIQAGGKINENISFELPSEGSYYASVIVKSKDGSVIRRSSDFWFTIEPNRSKLKLLKERIGESLGSMARISNPVSGNLRSEAGKLLADIQKLENYADTAWKAGKWVDLTLEISRKDTETGQHLNKVKWSSFNNWSTSGDFGIALTHAVIKLRKDAIFPLPVAGTKPGDYTGTITLSADGMKKVEAYVKCRVWNFELPVASHLKTHSWDQIEYMADFYNMEEYPLEWYQKFCELLLKNRFNPGSAGVNYVSEKPDNKGNYDFSKVEKVLKYCIDRGLDRFSIVQMKKGLYTPEEAEQAYKFVEAYAKFLKEKGWLDKALVELWDEPTDLEYPYIKERAERLKKIDPDLRLQLFAEGGPYDFFDRSTDKYGLNDLVDIWAPVNIIESPETQAKGGEIWTYFCTLARESAPNFFIDCPAIYQRSIAWYCWMYGVDGFEHWSSNYFWRNVHKGKPMNQKWPNVPWDSRTYYYFNGEGQLVYPGPDGIPYSSVRLENFRDGMDDYEYLYKLRELLAKYESNLTDTELKSYRQLLNPEDYLIFKYPRDIKRTLENTLRYPDQPEKILETREKIGLAIEKIQGMK